MKGGDKVITATIAVRNLHCLCDLDNTENRMNYLATIYIENKPVRSMQFQKLESAHKYVSMYVGKE